MTPHMDEKMEKIHSLKPESTCVVKFTTVFTKKINNM